MDITTRAHTLQAVLLLLFLGTVIPFLQTSFAQQTPYGKNKVQYTKFDWYYIQSNHFDIYFTTGGEYLAEYTADAAEAAYQSITRTFRYQITNRVPIIVYNSHNDFQQTNVVNVLLGEGIGGVTELFKNRVVIPFEGDYRKFRHVIHHELVHAVINDMFYGGSIQSIIANNITLRLPLWLNEGLAEYEALRWDTHTDMFMRDATIHGYLPPIPYLDGYLAYRGGQSVWHYIATKYGEQKIAEILARIRGTRSVDGGFRSALGLSVDELSERWHKDLKVTYWPDIAKREEPADFARRLTDHTKDGSFYNTSPALSPQGNQLAFISNRDDYFDVFIMNTIDGSIERKLVKGQRTTDFEELHLLTPGITWSPDGQRIAMAVKAGARDAIMIIDVNTRRRERLVFDLDGIFSVDWSPTGDKLAFVGNKRHYSDIYVYDLKTKELLSLTNDMFSEFDPAWSADGTEIYFSSSRGDYHSGRRTPEGFRMQDYENEHRDIFKVNVATREITRITEYPLSDQSSPVLTSDGRYMLFVSDMNGINNIYLKDLSAGTVRPITNSLNGVYQLSLSRDGNRLAFASLTRGGFDLYLMRTPLERDLGLTELEPTAFAKRRARRAETTVKHHTEAAEPEMAEGLVPGEFRRDTTHLYGDEVEIDFRSYVFEHRTETISPARTDTAHLLAVTDNLDDEGNYRINKYKLNFSPDIVYANAGYSTFYGVQGSTVMAFSDMLGNHQIFLLTNLLIDLKNSDYAMAYLYLPERIDYGVQGFHSARFLILDDIFGGSLYRFRTYGATGIASYPFSRFTRIEFGFSWFNISRENLDFALSPPQRRSLLIPTLSYVEDNSLWGLTSPNNGMRNNMTIYGSPYLGRNSLEFVSATIDYRQYYKLWRNYSFALRLAGGGSFGRDPQRFIIGGVDNWINRRFEDNRIPIERPEDFIFLTAGIPLRGYNYNAQIGTKYAMVNSEFRFPFFGYLSAGPVPFFHSLTGVLFLDVGSAWTRGRDYKTFGRDAQGNRQFQDLLTGMGTGARIVFLGFLVRFDMAWAFNWNTFSKPKYYLSLGADF